jgi:predicted nucleic acid-binding protein
MAKQTAKTQAVFVLDGSVTLAWYFADEKDAYADGVAATLPASPPVVPALWPLEVANAVLMGERRKSGTTAKASVWLQFLLSLPITIDDETNVRAWDDILNLARTHGLTAYDAAYLELALRRGLPMATLDSKLKSAANAAGVAEYKP